MGQSEAPTLKLKRRTLGAPTKNLVDQAISSTMVNGFGVLFFFCQTHLLEFVVDF
jgi:hypothetical protein